MLKEEIKTKAIRFSVRAANEEAGHAYLYFIQNDLHVLPYGLLEDLYVADAYRQAGIGRRLLEAVIEAARPRCYKLVACSRSDGTRDNVHQWYVASGLKEHGTEFRMNF